MRTLYATSVVKDSMTGAPYAEQRTRKTSWGAYSSLGGGTVGKVVGKLLPGQTIRCNRKKLDRRHRFKGRYAIGGEILPCVVETDN